MKKFLAFVTALCMILALTPWGAIRAYAADSSYYASFSCDGKSYSIDSITGSSEIQLSTILDALEISGSVSAASVSEGQGMTVTTETLTLTKPFGTGWLRVTAGGTAYQIIITSIPNSIGYVLYGTLFFDKNGGSGIMDGLPVQEYTQTLLPDCTFTPPDGYEFDQWEINGVRYNANTLYTFGQTTTAKAIWKLREGVHSITATYDSSVGDVIVRPTMAAQGETVTVTVQPAAGNAVDSISYSYGTTTEQTLSGGENGVYTFSMPDENTTVSVTFTEAEEEPIAYVDENGSNQSCNNYRFVKSNDNTWDGWVVASQDLTLDSRVTVSGAVNLILMDGKTLTVTNGIQVSEGSTLNIYSQTGNTGALTAGNKQNNYHAGIGGNANHSTAGTININGGKITATGGYDSAGIGGASGNNNLGKAGNITIRGKADVTATAGRGGAAIGSAPGGLGGSVTISGSAKVNAIGVEDSTGAGAGIGGGRNGYCDRIVITGGTVTATCCGSKCAAIGTGSGTGKGGTITITGGSVTATATKYDGVGIGGRNVTITIGGTAVVTATGTKSNAGIGGLYESQYGNEIIIKGGTVKAYAGGTSTGAAAIGSGNKAGGTTVITISGGTVEAHGDNVYGVGIGGGNTGTSSETVTVNISGGSVTATGRVGIGTANASEAAQTITISGGTVTAAGAVSGGNPGAAIGQGNNSKSLTTINITGGKVTANGTGNGIGAGANSNAIPTVKLRWTGANDEITAISYVGHVKLEKPFKNKSDNSEVFAAGALTDNSVIANKTLIPTDTSKFAVIIDDILYGSITANPWMQTANESVTLTIVPVNGSEMDTGSLSVTYTDGSGTTRTVATVKDSTDSNKYTFTMPGADVTVTASFTSAWQKLQKLIDDGASAITLTGDVVACTGEPALLVPADKTVTIDLNGYKIDRHLTYGVKDGYVMMVRGTLTIKDESSSHNGKITGGNNKASGSTGYGGGLFVQGAGNVTLISGSISGNTAENYGGGVYLGSSSKLNMNGGFITNNSAKFGAGVAANDNSTLTITNGTISSNNASFDGGGVNLRTDCIFTMTGGVITNNTATRASGGINYTSYNKVGFGGLATVTNNTVSGKPYNVHIPADKTITIESALTGTIGVTTVTAPTAAAPVVLTKGLSGKGDAGNFTSDNDAYEVDVNTSSEAVLKLLPHAHRFTYSVSGTTITATCNLADCTLTDQKTTLTINAPLLTAYGQTGEGIEKATFDGLAGFNTATKLNVSADSVQYYKAVKSNGTYVKDGDALSAAPAEAGDYLAEITLTGVKTGEGENKSITASVGYTVAKAQLTDVSVAQTAPLTYTGQPQTPEVTACATAVNNQTVTFTFSRTQNGTYGDMPKVTNVSDGGTFYYKATAPNHEDAAGTFTVTVNRANQTISADGVTAAYGDTDKRVSARVTEPAAGGAVTYTVKDGSGDYLGVDADTGALTIKAVPQADGKAYVTVTAAETDNYAETALDVTVTISRAAITITAKNQSIYVDDTVPDLSSPVLNTHYTVAGLVGEDILTTLPALSYQKDGTTVVPDHTAAGTYDIVPSAAAASDNYTISYVKGTLTINERGTQIIAAEDVTVTYGDADKRVSASVTDPATGGGEISYAVKNGSEDYIDVASDGKLTIKKVPENGKAYVIVTSSATAAFAEANREVAVTINKAKVTVTAKDQSIHVNDTVPDLSTPVLDTHYSVTGLVGEDTLTTAPTLTYQKEGTEITPDSSTAGTYDIVPSGASAGDNYTIVYEKGTLTITNKLIQTIAADDVTAAYGDTDRKVSASVTDPAEGGGAISYAVKTGSEDYIDVDAATGSLTIKKVPADGKAYVTVTAAETDTCAKTVRDVTVTLNRKSATVTAAAQTIPEDGTIETGTAYAALTDALSGHSLSEVTLTAAEGKITPSAAKILDAGNQDVTGNYSISYVPGDLTVLARLTRTVTFRVVNGAWDDGSSAEKTVTLTGYEGDTLKLNEQQIPAAGNRPGEGYEAGGWDTAPDTKTAVKDGTVYIYTYAEKKSVVAVVTFDANGGSGEMAPVTVTIGESWKLPACGFTAPDGKKFDSWSLGKVGEKITITGDITVKAKWKNLPVKVQLKPLLQLVPSGKTSLKLTWEKTAGADGFDIFTARCNTGKYTLAGSVPAKAKRVFILKGLTPGVSYKAYIRPWKTVKGKKQYIGRQTPNVHAIAGGSNDAYTTPKSVNVKKRALTVQTGKTCVIEASVIGLDNKKEILAHDGALLRYYSSNTVIATVNTKGKVTGKNPGTCVIHVLANNGVRADVTIKVTREAPPETEVTYQGGVYRLNKAGTAAVFASAEKKNAVKLTIAATVKIGGKSYKVTEILSKACAGMKRLKALTIGKNVEKIGKKAFYSCPQLKTILIRTGKLKNADAIGADAFGKGAKALTVKCPAKKLKKYTAWLKKKGLPKETKFTAFK